VGDAGIGLTGSGEEDDLGTIGILLRAGAGRHAALQFGALGGQQPNPAATLFGHASNCFRCCRSQPGMARIDSFSASTNRTRY
jgi:hypothetical protein